MFIAFSHTTLLESSLEVSASITILGFVDIMVLSLLIEDDRLFLFVSLSLIRKYTETATAK